MSSPKYITIPVFFLVAGCLLGAEDKDSPPPKDFGYGPALTAKDRNVLLIQLLPSEKNDREYAVNAKVLADLHGKIKKGATVRISGEFTPFSGSAAFNLPAGYDSKDKDVIYVWPVQEIGPEKYKFLNDLLDFPIGVDSDTRISILDKDKVEAALKELLSAVEKPDHSGPTRARATELLKEKNFYLWTLGIWRIAHDTNAADIKLLEELFREPDLTPAQAVWLERVLTYYLRGDEPVPRPPAEEMEGLVRDYLRAYAQRHPGPPGSVAPATAPARPQRDTFEPEP